MTPDYSDHGDPATSAVTASTHPYQPTGDLARTGTDLGALTTIGVLLVIVAAVLLTATRKTSSKRRTA